MADLKDAGVDYDDVIDTLEREGVEKFEASWGELLEDGEGPAGRGRRVSDAPVDPSSTPAWSRLERLASDFTPDLRALVRRRPRPGRPADLHRG